MKSEKRKEIERIIKNAIIDASNEEIADAYAHLVSCGECPVFGKCDWDCSTAIYNYLEKGDAE